MIGVSEAAPVPRVRYDVGVRCYLGLQRFAREVDQPYERLQRWRLQGPIWVPAPVISIGRWPGWPLPMIQRWRPDVSAGCGPVPFHWPEPTIHYADTATVCRLHRVSPAGLRQRIERNELATPAVWVDGKPGWPIQ